MKLVKVLAAALSVAPIGALAETEILMRQDGWEVALTDFGGGLAKVCSMRTTNEGGHSFSFLGTDGRGATLLAQTDQYGSSMQVLDMTVSVDGAEWTYTMDLGDGIIKANMLQNPRSSDLMNALSNGRMVSLQSVDGGPTLEWSLEGIDGPFRRVLGCWKEIVEARG